MIDKTKPWLTAAHSESITCKQAGKELYEILKTANVELTGVGVCLSDDKQNAAIYILLLKNGDVSKVPSQFKGYQVKINVTGVIRAL
jgi:hypothetical protein